MLLRLTGYIEEVAGTAEWQDLGGGANECVRAVGPAEFVHHINGDGDTRALRVFGRELFVYRTWQIGWCAYIPLFYYSDDFFLGRLLKLFGRTAWSTKTSRMFKAPTQED